MKAQFLIAAPMSGSGKTTIARGLMALFKRQGLTVQPFKCGPDYIDTKFHEAVCGRPSVNLDTFMASPEHVRELFLRYGADADVCIVEGMMGLFDGYDRERGSSYEITQVLSLPIVLVIDAKSAAYSMAALLSGFLKFRTDVRFAGVIYNKVGSERHEALLRQVCGDLGIPCFGCIPKSAALEQSSRYLGLDFSQEPDTEAIVNLLTEHIDIEKLLLLTPRVDESDKKQPLLTSIDGHSDENHALRTSVLVARNAESFSFTYAETLDRLGDVRFFDPETDVPDFDGVGLLYLPGGYPEKHLDALVKNAACREAIRVYAERGGRIVAECGGMMYLCRSIVTDDGEYPMCSVLPYSITARKNDRRLSLGYRRFTLDGREYRGHEFHYTQFLDAQQLPSLQGEGLGVGSVTQVYDALGRPVATPIFRYKNVLASYTHLYAGFALNDK